MKKILMFIVLLSFSKIVFPQINNENTDKEEKSQLYILFGLHAFIPNYHNIFDSKISFQEMIGGELLLIKYNIALDLRRNYWISFYGGSLQNEIKSLNRYDHIGIKKSFKIKNQTVKIGLSHAWISDMVITKYTFDTITGKVRYYPFRAISPSIIYNIGKFDFELRVYFPYNKNAYTEEYNKFDRSQINLGIVYRFNPN